MNDKMVAHVWFSGDKPSGGRGNLFFRGDTIYSYGSHFPIARKVSGATLLTTRGYSSSTARHIRYVRQAISGRVFRVPDPSSTDYKRLYESYVKRFNEALWEAAKPRIRPTTRENHVNEARNIASEANEFATFFKLRRKPLAVPEDVEKFLADLTAKNDRAIKRDHVKREKRRKELEAQAKIDLEEWKTGKLTYTPYATFAGLPVEFRVRGDQVETSLGAEFPIEHAKKAWPFVKSLLASGKPWETNGKEVRLGHFKLDSIDEEGAIHAGCHYIPKDKVYELAKLIGVE